MRNQFQSDLRVIVDYLAEGKEYEPGEWVVSLQIAVRESGCLAVNFVKQYRIIDLEVFCCIAVYENYDKITLSFGYGGRSWQER